MYNNYKNAPLNNRIAIRNNVMNLSRTIKKRIMYSFPYFLQRCDWYIQITPINYDEGKNWWVWNHEKGCWLQKDEVDIINTVREERILRVQNQEYDFKKKRYLTYAEAKEESLDNYLNIGHILHTLSLSARKYAPYKSPENTVQFMDTLVNVNTGKILKSSPEFFVTNTIPWSIGSSEETPTMDKLFKEWVGEKHVPLLYELLAYCCLPSYPIHRIFVLNGSGANGKSQYIGILNKFVGEHNRCSTTLGRLSNKHEAFSLYKKTLCTITETHTGKINNSEILKMLTGGEDPFPFEAKYKGVVHDINYAKIVMATNSLPATTDYTDGFFRRMMLIDFPNNFEGGKLKTKIDIYKTIPDIEYNNLAKKCIRILGELLKRAKFTGEKSLAEKKAMYKIKSEPLQQFIELFCDDFSEEIGTDFSMKFSDFFDEFSNFCNKQNIKTPSKKAVGAWLNKNKYDRKKIGPDKHIVGLMFKDSMRTEEPKENQ